MQDQNIGNQKIDPVNKNDQLKQENNTKKNDQKANFFHYSRIHIRFFSTLFLLGSFLFFVFVIFLLLLNLYFLPRSNEYLQKYTQEIKRQTGLQIKVGKVNGELIKLNPHVVINNLQIINKDKTAFQAKEIDAELSWVDLFTGNIKFNYLEIIDANIKIERLKNGQFILAGLNKNSSDDPMSFENQKKILLWILNQESIQITNSTIIYSDELIKNKYIKLKADIEFGSQSSQKVVKAIFQPTSDFANKIELLGSFQQIDIQNIQNNIGKINLKVKNSNLHELFYFISREYQMNGFADLDLWVNFTEQDNINLVISTNIQNFSSHEFPINFQSVKGRVYGSFQDFHLLLNTSSLEIISDIENVPIPNQIDLAIKNAGRVDKFAFSIPQISLTSANKILIRLIPWYPELEITEKLSVSGNLINNFFYWQRNQIENQYQFTSDFESINWNSNGQIPGVQKLSGKLKVENKKGEIVFNSRNISFQLPKLMYLANHKFDKLVGKFNWQYQQDDLAFKFSGINFSNPDGNLYMEGGFNLIDQQPLINISAALYDGKGSGVWRYMPRVVDAEVVDWLKKSIVGGSSSSTILNLRGNLNNFPFADQTDIAKKEIFQVFVPFKNAELKYHPQWPKVENANGLLLINNNQMNINIVNGKLSGAEAGGTEVSIPKLDGSILNIRGQAVGELKNFKSYILNSPLNEVIPFVETISDQGSSKLDLDLNIPLNNIDNIKVKGQLSTITPSFSILPSFPSFTEVVNKTEFNENGIVSIEGSGKIFAIPFTLSKTETIGKSIITAKKVPIDLFSQYDVLNLPILKFLSGYVQLNGEVLVDKDGFKISWQADTQNIKSELPSPLKKETDINWQMFGVGEVKNDQSRIGILLENENNLPFFVFTTDWITEFQDNFRANLIIDNNLSEINKTNFYDIASFSSSGINYQINSKSLDLQKWQEIISDFNQQSNSTVFQSGKFNIEEVLFFNNKFPDVKGSFSLTNNNLNRELEVSLDSKKIAGNIQISFVDQISNLTANLSKLIINFDEKKLANSTDIDKNNKAQNAQYQWLPPIQLNIKNLQVGNYKFESFKFNGKPIASGYQFQNVDLEADTLKINIKGSTESNTNLTQLQVDAKSDNLSAYLNRYYRRGILVDTIFEASALVEWKGGLLDFNINNLRGEASFNMEEGKFAKIEPGVGRLLTLLSLQNILRRVAFDFSDAVEEGFNFDRIYGDFIIDGKNLKSNNIVIDSSIAKVLMQGKVNYIDNLQDLELYLLPNISGGISTGAAVFGTPVAGIFTWLAQKLFGNPFDQAFAKKITVKGSLSDPLVEEFSLENQIEDPNDITQDRIGNLIQYQTEIQKLLNLTDPTLDPLFSEELLENVKNFNRSRPAYFRAECK